MKPRFSIKKISEIPFRINRDTDKVLMSNLKYTDTDNALEYLGYSHAKKKEVYGTLVYYKTRRDGVYISYTGRGD